MQVKDWVCKWNCRDVPIAKNMICRADFFKMSHLSGASSGLLCFLGQSIVLPKTQKRDSKITEPVVLVILDYGILRSTRGPDIW